MSVGSDVGWEAGLHTSLGEEGGETVVVLSGLALLGEVAIRLGGSQYARVYVD